MGPVQGPLDWTDLIGAWPSRPGILPLWDCFISLCLRIRWCSFKKCRVFGFIGGRGGEAGWVRGRHTWVVITLSRRIFPSGNPVCTRIKELIFYERIYMWVRVGGFRTLLNVSIVIFDALEGARFWNELRMQALEWGSCGSESPPHLLVRLIIPSSFLPVKYLPRRMWELNKVMHDK